MSGRKFATRVELIDGGRQVIIETDAKLVDIVPVVKDLFDHPGKPKKLTVAGFHTDLSTPGEYPPDDLDPIIETEFAQGNPADA